MMVLEKTLYAYSLNYLYPSFLDARKIIRYRKARSVFYSTVSEKQTVFTNSFMTRDNLSQGPKGTKLHSADKEMTQNQLALRAVRSLSLPEARSGKKNCLEDKHPISISESLHEQVFLGGLKVGQTRWALQKFINLCMKNGNKGKSYKIILNTLYRISESKALAGPRGLSQLITALENVKPIIEVKKVRIAGTTQIVPSIISKNRQLSLAIRWIIEAAILRRKSRKALTLDQCIMVELLDASQNIGVVRKKRDDLHKLAESNRGFAHYRWW